MNRIRAGDERSNNISGWVVELKEGEERGRPGFLLEGGNGGGEKNR